MKGRDYMLKKGFALAAALMAVLSVKADIPLAESVIVHPDRMEMYEKTAVDELAVHLERLSGKRPVALPESRAGEWRGTRIYVGDTKAAKEAGIHCGTMIPHQYRIKTAGGSLFIAGNSPGATLYGVYDLLQNQLGVYWLAPEYTHFPEKPVLTVREQDRIFRPSVAVRDIYHNQFNNVIHPDAKEQWTLFSRRNGIYKTVGNLPGSRLSYAPGKVSHTFFRYLPPEKYFREHPEYFSMLPDGKREYRPYGQLCLSNPDVRRIVFEQLVTWIRNDRKKRPVNYPTLYDFSQEDNTDFLCCCPECKKLIRKYGSDTGLLLDFVNELAGKIRKLYPDVYIRTFAYVSTNKPLETIHPAENVVIFYTDLYSKSINMYPLTHPANRGQLELLTRWSRETPNLELWDYILPSDAPYSSVRAAAADAVLMHRLGIDRVTVESEFSSRRPLCFQILQYFVEAQVLFDSSKDPEKLIRLFMDSYYGPAGGDMLALLNYVEKMQQEKPTISQIAWHSRILAHYSYEFLMKSRDFVLRAMKKAGKNPALRGRISRELAIWDYALLKNIRNAPQGKIEFSVILEEYRNAMLAEIDYRLDRPNNKQKRRQELKNEIELLTLVFKDLPPEISSIPPERIKYLAYPHFIWGRDGKIVKDPVSSMAKSILWQPFDPAKHERELITHKGRIPVGVYDRILKRSYQARMEPFSDEKYHWVKLFRVHLGPDSIIWLKNWHAGFIMKDFYTISDGVAEKDDPNIYDVWISIRYEGPAYSRGSDKANGIYMDRALLVPANTRNP